LPLPTKQPPRLRPATTKANASATFFMRLPLLLCGPVRGPRAPPSISAIAGASVEKAQAT
jgi:hypothetical protein